MSGRASPEQGRRLRPCPLEQGELVTVATCTGCPYDPGPEAASCLAGRRRQMVRTRGFWDREELEERFRDVEER